MKLFHEKNPLRENNPAAIIFQGVRGMNIRESDSPSWLNPQEMIAAVQYCMLLYGMGLTPDKVGIIAPYRKQVSTCV